MPTMNYRGICLLLGLIAAPGMASAWWNDDWTSRKQITLDASITGADIKEVLTDFPVLVRLHPGNFSYFSEMAEGGKDMRFMADDKTPLKFQIEKFDAINEMALVWVKAPKVQGGAASDTLHLYYGNEDAPAPDNGVGVFDDNFAVVYHFDDKNPSPQDATAYGNHAVSSTAQPEAGGWIGSAAKLAGSGTINIKPAPSLDLKPENGWSFSAWVKIDQPQTDAYVFRASDAGSSLELMLRNDALVARYDVAGTVVETPPAPLQEMGKWRHVAVILRADKLELFLDGNNTSTVAVTAIAMSPTVTLGGSTMGGFLTGLLDEVQISNKARYVDWIKFSARSQSPDFTVVGMGQDEGKDSGGSSSFGVIVQSVTIDGWVVIALTGIMFVVAMIVMVVKVVVLRQVRKDNKAFMQAYESLSPSDDISILNREESEEEKVLADSPFVAAISGSHDHFQSSPLYHIYQTGIREMKKRVGDLGQKPLSAEALSVIRVMLDSILVRESQRLNDKMVLLTIAIAGGPFLGLLGTVVGVMITFAVIAASGDVNINSIAPGIAAALLATVAGLAVAIPALFAYNYLLVQIKDVVADMRVFSDEFLAMLVERAADRAREANES